MRLSGRVLIVAGSDSGGGAGIQADIKTVTALGGYAMTAITALTAQNTEGVFGVHGIPPDFIAEQMRLVLRDLGAGAIKIGMLHTAEVIDAVADVIEGEAKGIPLVETVGYKVHASRREGPGMAEIHTRDTDIIYVLDGTATLVTGGRAIDAETTAPFELRGSRVDGGRERSLSKGDLVIVPQGVPHWFKRVSAPFLYYVVKTTAADDSATTAPIKAATTNTCIA